jgi:hypothetical protein
MLVLFVCLALEQDSKDGSPRPGDEGGLSRGRELRCAALAKQKTCDRILLGAIVGTKNYA